MKLCGAKLEGVKGDVRCTLPEGHEGMHGLADLSGFYWIDRALSDDELDKLSAGVLAPEDV